MLGGSLGHLGPRYACKFSGPRESPMWSCGAKSGAARHACPVRELQQLKVLTCSSELGGSGDLASKSIRGIAGVTIWLYRAYEYYLLSPPDPPSRKPKKKRHEDKGFCECGGCGR